MSPSCSSKRPAINTVSKLFRKVWCRKHAWRAGPPTLRRPMIRATFGLAASCFSGLTEAANIVAKLAGYCGAAKVFGPQHFYAHVQGVHWDVSRTAQLPRG